MRWAAGLWIGTLEPELKGRLDDVRKDTELTPTDGLRTDGN